MVTVDSKCPDFPVHCNRLLTNDISSLWTFRDKRFSSKYQHQRTRDDKQRPSGNFPSNYLPKKNYRKGNG